MQYYDSYWVQSIQLAIFSITAQTQKLVDWGAIVSMSHHFIQLWA
jgi:hypothetical protein